MVETITYARILLDDLDLGSGTRDVTLQDGATYTLDRIPGRLDIVDAKAVLASAGASTLSVPFQNPNGSIIHGVTLQTFTVFGTANGLTSVDIGDNTYRDIWGQQIDVTIAAETDATDFAQAIPQPTSGGGYTVILTAVGGTFDGQGAATVQLHYSVFKHR